MQTPYQAIQAAALRNVHVTKNGRLIYNRLIDDGTNVLNFASGFGFVCRDQMRLDGCLIEDGWPEL